MLSGEAHQSVAQQQALLERQKAARVLLRRCLVTTSFPDEQTLPLVRRHGKELKEMFARILGYRLDLRADYARLVKRPVHGLPARPARAAKERRLERYESGFVFGRRDYTYLALVTAALEQSGVQVTLSLLAGKVKQHGESVPALAVDLDRHPERLSFVRAVSWLEARGVVVCCDGDTNDFVSRGGDALYDVHRDLVGALVSTPVPISLVEDPAELYVDNYADSDQGRRERLRHRLNRRIVEQSVVYRRDLQAEAAALFNAQAHAMVANIEKLTGCHVERRAEGFCLLDEHDGALTDQQYPGDSSVARVALLLGEEMVSSVDYSEQPHNAFVAGGEIDAILATIQDQHRDSLATDYRDDLQALRSEALAILRDFDLVRAAPAATN